MEAIRTTTVVVMSFNVWGAGGNQDKSIDEDLAVIKAVNPDIIGIQETRAKGENCEAENCVAAGSSVASEIAHTLGYYFYDQSANNDALWSNAILSKYPVL